MTDRKHNTIARKYGVTPEQYAEMRHAARIRLDRRMKKVK